ncbi:hypothetical protein [Arthrobacter rhizosphaerae]|uniref:hypothetical protein n=1 Tax=Arthrobacter rhizosphaerae TaxID=2855490 RepID=UPI001FF6A3CA|nr:hypothetical protein [Arthrobacter rhizosphaerae]
MTSEANNHPAARLKMILSVHDWTLIDATMDNTVAIADQNGDESTADQGGIVRKTGWAAARHHPKADQGWEGWPPLEEDLSIELPATTWRFVAGQLRRWDEVDALVNPRGDGNPEPRGLELARMLEERIS